MAAAVGDQVRDRDHLQPVALAVGRQVGHARHRPVVVHDLADHAGRDQPGEPGEVDAGLGLPDALQHAAGLGLEREHVAGLDELPRARVGIDRHLDRARPVGGRDPGADAGASLDRDRERGLEGRLVLGRHQVEAELVAALGGQGEADQPAPLLAHEVDRLGGDELGGHRQVALVLTVLVVADDDHLALADVLDRFLDRGERGPGRAHRAPLAISLSTYLASTSTSRFTIVPASARAEISSFQRLRDQRNGKRLRRPAPRR